MPVYIGQLGLSQSSLLSSLAFTSSGSLRIWSAFVCKSCTAEVVTWGSQTAGGNSDVVHDLLQQGVQKARQQTTANPWNRFLQGVADPRDE